MPTILLVEDNEMNRDMLSRRLQRKGFQVIIAVDGAQGVAMAQADAPDLILMDMSLPVPVLGAFKGFTYEQETISCRAETC